MGNGSRLWLSGQHLKYFPVGCEVEAGGILTEKEHFPHHIFRVIFDEVEFFEKIESLAAVRILEPLHLACSFGMRRRNL